MNEHIRFGSHQFSPKWDKTNTLYERTEKDGGKTMISRKHPELQQLYYNQTTLSILELCDGASTVEEITHKLTRKYYGVQYDELLDDVISTIHMLWRLGFIIWNGDNPFLSIYGKANGEYYYSMLNEDQAVAWMEHNRPCYFNPMNIEESNYTETAIKQNSFSFYETFFQLKKHDKELITISLVIPIGKECFFKIGILNYDIAEENIEEVIDFLKWACEKHKQFFSLSANVESVLCYVHPSDIIHIHFLETYFKAESVGVLHKELQDNSDLEIYQCVIK